MLIASLLKLELNKRQQKNARFSLRSFAKLLRADASFVSKVMAGKKSPSEKTFREWAERLGIHDSAVDQALEKQKILRQEGQAGHSPFEPLALEVFEKHYEWYYPLLLEFFALPGGSGQLASAARQLQVPLAEIKTAVANMLALGLLKKKPGETKYQRVHLSTAHALSLTSDRLRAMQVKYLQTAISAIGNIPINQRENTTVTLSLDEDDLLAVRAILKKARQKVGTLSSKKSKSRRVVYNISMALYPVLEQEKSE